MPQAHHGPTGKPGAQEAIVVSITYDHGARKRSYELLAEAFGL